MICHSLLEEKPRTLVRGECHMTNNPFWLSSKKYNKIIKLTPLPHVDLVILRRKKKWEVLIFSRRITPGKGKLCLIGGRQMKDETLKGAINRQAGEVGLRVKVIKPFSYNFPAWVEDSKKQDTTKQATTCIYPVEIVGGKPKIGKEVNNPTWIDACELPDGFMFDHREKVVKTLKQIGIHNEL